MKVERVGEVHKGKGLNWFEGNCGTRFGYYKHSLLITYFDLFSTDMPGRYLCFNEINKLDKTYQ